MGISFQISSKASIADPARELGLTFCTLGCEGLSCWTGRSRHSSFSWKMHLLPAFPASWVSAGAEAQRVFPAVHPAQVSSTVPRWAWVGGAAQVCDTSPPPLSTYYCRVCLVSKADLYMLGLMLFILLAVFMRSCSTEGSAAWKSPEGSRC